MPDSLSVLILENEAADYDLVARELRRSGFVTACQRVETESEYLSALTGKPDIILADYKLNGFDALRALELLQESGLVIPFIVLTGAVSEETVVECMKRGAADYLLKDRILRLGPAVRRALDEAEMRRQKQHTERMLRQKNIELEEQYRQSQMASRMKSAFLASISHELRTPLTAVIGFTGFVVDGKMGPIAPAQLKLLQHVLQNARHLLGLINDVLDLAKVESGSMQFRPVQTSIAEIVEETIFGQRLLAAEKRLGLNCEVRLPLDKVLLDPQKLRQVLLNYISNAVKFTAADGIVTVRVTLEDRSSFRLEVEDNGIGIASADLERLFQDFHQLEDGLSRPFPGSGLGLALTKRLVEAQGGRVGVSSVPGKGSIFFAVLPYAPMTNQTVEAETVRI
ncbi:MAG: ATP-binding protein [Acidobacteriota bacterium]